MNERGYKNRKGRSKRKERSRWSQFTEGGLIQMPLLVCQMQNSIIL